MTMPRASATTDLRLHYRCSFEVSGPAAASDTFSSLIRAVRQWLSDTRKIPKQSISGAWFYNKGEWSSDVLDRASIRTDRLEQSTGSLATWALRYEHVSDSKFDPKSYDNFRVWRTDIALNQVNEAVISFNLQTSHYLLSSYFGPEPPEPEPNSPGVVKNLIKSKTLRCFSGSEPLLASSSTLSSDDAEMFLQRLVDPSRKCPIIYVTREYQTGQPALDAHNLAWGLAGLATVYVAESSWVDKVTEKVFPEGFGCWNGKVRIYLPGSRFNRPEDHKKHRYFSPEQIRALGEIEFQRILTRSLARRLFYSFDSAPRSIDDIRYVKHQNHLKSLLGRASASASLEEMVTVLTELNGELVSKTVAHEQSLESTQARLESLELELETLEAENRSLSYDATSARQQLAQHAEARQLIADELHGFHSLRKLPTCVADCVQFYLKSFPGRIRLTSQGSSSLEKCQFGVQEVWQALWGMTHELYDLFFGESGRGADIEKRFHDVTGFELAMTEGKQTKADKQMMRKRQDQFEGEDLDITPHLKLRSGGSYFRIYFGIVKSRNLIVIGNCTDHLDTAGTRRRK